MVRTIKKNNSKPRYIVFETGALNPKKVTRLSLSEAKKVAENLLSKTQRKGRRVVIQRIENIFEE